MPSEPREKSPAGAGLNSARHLRRQKNSPRGSSLGDSEATTTIEDALCDLMEDNCPPSPSKALLAEANFGQPNFETPHFSLRNQSIIFFDWDETLFPTTELMERWGQSWDDPNLQLSPHQHRLLDDWRDALREYITEARRLSGKVVIVTNARSPWVTMCLEKYAPDLLPLFEPGPEFKVVYAVEELERRATTGFRHRPLRQELSASPDEREEFYTRAKFVVMKSEVELFYSQYEGQTWKNILSLGDMFYEHDAIQDVTFHREPPERKDERVRTKAIVLPTEPTMSQITLRLRFSKRMLPAYMAFDGSIDLDLRGASDPLQAISDALCIPDLVEVRFSRHAWGRQSTPGPEDDVAGMLDSIAEAVSTKLSL
eukprot:TRINITY_DN8674_c0_g1_i1.p1 TRINITY_DN8674_c0_g1~~TRINITY_DN8674_c0_g1_i1.p1  ORF type:complete len:379 (+),score=67.88 TRINITY_DN8674_c0_g1_i1:30-1139(+)